MHLRARRQRSSTGANSDDGANDGQRHDAWTGNAQWVDAANADELRHDANEHDGHDEPVPRHGHAAATLNDGRQSSVHADENEHASDATAQWPNSELARSKLGAVDYGRRPVPDLISVPGESLEMYIAMNNSKPILKAITLILI